MEKGCRREPFLIIATILGLHLALLWLLVVRVRVLRPVDDGAALALIYLPPVRELAASSAPIKQTPTGAAQDRVRVSPQAEPPTRPPSTGGAVLPFEQGGSSHAPIDWNGELGRAASAASARETAPSPRPFGFPEASVPHSKTEAFGWDYAATHRVESLPDGGILLHINDHCVLVMFPYPLVGCGIGKKTANGQLFEHMHEPLAPQGGAAPP